MEMLVALVLLGLVSGLATPVLWRLFERRAEAAAWDGLEQQVGQLRLQAWLDRRERLLVAPPGPDRPAGTGGDSPLSVPVSLPEEWSVTVPEPVRFRIDGLCDGGELIVVRNGIADRVLMARPRCAITRERIPVPARPVPGS